MNKKGDHRQVYVINLNLDSKPGLALRQQVLLVSLSYFHGTAPSEKGIVRPKTPSRISRR